MASTHTTRNRLEKQGTGENDSTWGTRLNERTTDMIDEAMDGYDLTDINGTGTYTLSANNGLTDESRNRYLDLTGTLTGNRDVVVPTQERWWFIRNGTDGAFTVTVKTTAGTGITIEQGKSAILFCDGTNVEYLLPGQGWSGEQAATAAGTDTYTATITPAPLAYFDGMQVDLIFTNANTGAATINLNSLGAVAIERNGAAIAASEIPATGRVPLTYDGTAFQMAAVKIYVADLIDTVDTAQLTADAVDGTKIADDSVAGEHIAMGSDAQGDILFRGAIVYERLGTGTVGQILNSGGAAADPTWEDAPGITTDTMVDATNGGSDDLTLVDFTGIPATATRITIMFDRLRLTGLTDLIVQIGDAGGFETTGYVSGSGYVSASGQDSAGDTTGFIIQRGVAAYAVSGHMILTLIDAATDLWVSSHSAGNSASFDIGISGGGRKALSDTLTQVRITRLTSGTFDLGNINIMYE